MPIFLSSGSRNIQLLLHILPFLLFVTLQSSSQAELTELYHICPAFSNNTASTKYSYNLGALFNGRLKDEGGKSRYNKADVGEYPDKVYGLYLCRFDVSYPSCQNCIVDAIDTIIDKCYSTKEATIWYDECLVRFSNRSFASSLETFPTFYKWNTRNVTQPERFSELLVQSFNDTIAEAISQASKYAKQTVNVSSFSQLYSLVQCIPDLSIEECQTCLQTAVASGSEFFVGKEGSRVLMPSCNIRYELYPFFGDPEVGALIPISPPNKTTDSVDGGGTVREGEGGRVKEEGEGWKAVWIAMGTTLSAIIVALVGFFLWHKWTRSKNRKEKKANSQEGRLLRLGEGITGNNYLYDDLQGENQMESQEFPLFPLSLTLEATQHFSNENKLGEGGFGPVYKVNNYMALVLASVRSYFKSLSFCVKLLLEEVMGVKISCTGVLGVLADGKEIAVKRLSRTSGQGLQEFKNEVTLIAKLQHKNLVRLLGCCLEGNELLLIYEYMPNKSLDFLLFDSIRGIQLDWKRRLSIINGIARGLMYLHEDFQLKIIHRDLKVSNVLLEHEMNPKISDFGMARIFGGNQNEANTNRVVGTYGYMAPEYVMEGLFSIKSDVFSFGVLLLEILSGRKNSGFYLSEHGRSLLTYTWKLWCEGHALDLMDPVLSQSCVPVELLKYIHIGLLCVQEDPTNRPTMSSVVVMLASDTIPLPQPTQPPFSVDRVVVNSAELVSDNSVNEVTLSSASPR